MFCMIALEEIKRVKIEPVIAIVLYLIFIFVATIRP